MEKLLIDAGLERYLPFFYLTVSCGWAFEYGGETRYFHHDIDILYHLNKLSEKEAAL